MPHAIPAKSATASAPIFHQMHSGKIGNRPAAELRFPAESAMPFSSSFYLLVLRCLRVQTRSAAKTATQSEIPAESAMPLPSSAPASLSPNMHIPAESATDSWISAKNRTRRGAPSASRRPVLRSHPAALTIRHLVLAGGPSPRGRGVGGEVPFPAESAPAPVIPLRVPSCPSCSSWLKSLVRRY